MSDARTIVVLVTNQAREPLARHVEAAGGEIAEAAGGGVMAVFSSVAAALDAAEAIRRKPAAGAEGARIGLSAGDAVRHPEGWAGSVVVEASGLCAQAKGGQVLVADVVVRLAGASTAHTFAAAGRQVLAGLPGEREVFLLETAHELAPTVVLADDSVLLRSGIAGLLATHGFRVVGEAGDGDELLRLVETLRPDVCVVDIRMPPTHTLEGIRAAAEIRRRFPMTGVLLLSQHLESPAALSLLHEVASGIGYLLKDRVGDVQEFIAALSTVGAGGTALDPEVVARLIGRRRIADPIDELSPREIEVLSLMAEGRSNTAIGERLTVSLRTVEAHIASIFSKLGLEPAPEGHRRVQAVVAFLRRP